MFSICDSSNGRNFTPEKIENYPSNILTTPPSMASSAKLMSALPAIMVAHISARDNDEIKLQVAIEEGASSEQLLAQIQHRLNTICESVNYLRFRADNILGVASIVCGLTMMRDDQDLSSTTTQLINHAIRLLHAPPSAHSTILPIVNTLLARIMM